MWKPMLIAGAALATLGSQTQAQVMIRAPFVRVEVGGPAGPGTYVRAPFVNLYVPGGPPPGFLPPPPPGLVPPPGYIGPLPRIVNGDPNQPAPPAPVQPPLTPKPAAKPMPNADPDPDFVPPAPAQVNVLTPEDFVKNFQGKQGNYEITLKNPVTGQPTNVRFSLPGVPQRVIQRGDEIEFVFGVNSYVKLKFDRDGVMVISR